MANSFLYVFYVHFLNTTFISAFLTLLIRFLLPRIVLLVLSTLHIIPILQGQTKAPFTLPVILYYVFLLYSLICSMYFLKKQV